jgi:hypothetical protein
MIVLVTYLSEREAVARQTRFGHGGFSPRYSGFE